MKAKLCILLLSLFLCSPAYADSAVYHIADNAYEDTCGGVGADSTNKYNSNSYQFFGSTSNSSYSSYWRWSLDIPKGSTISKANVVLRADFANSGSLSAVFSALAPDGRWESTEGFSTSNYTTGPSLNAIPRKGAPVSWENIPNWVTGTWYTGPDISGLIQSRIDDGTYDPQDERQNHFGLVLANSSGNSYRTAAQEPDIDTDTAQLFVEYIPGSPPVDVDIEDVFHIADADIEDTYAQTGRADFNGFSNGNGWQYLGYASGNSYNAYWRWVITIPNGANITQAYVRLRGNSSPTGYLDVALQSLAPDGKWNANNGFSTVNYLRGSLLNQIPREGTPVAWNNVPGFNQGTWFYTPDITDLVRQRVNSPDYDPESSTGRYFGLVLYHVAGTSYRTTTQEPFDDSYTAELHIKWIPENGCGVPDAVEICGDGIDNNCNGEIDELCNTCPTADAGQDLTGYVGQSVQLDGSGSSDTDGDLLSYWWTLTEKPDSSSAELSSADSVMPQLTLDAPGEYLASLTVSDGACESEPDTVVISTLNSCPVADAGPDQSVYVGDNVALDAGLSRDNDGDLLTYTWSLISKPAGSGSALTSSTGENTSLHIDKPGEYRVQLIASDEDCESQPASVLISTINVPPVADAGSDLEGLVGYPTQLDGSASHDPDGDPLSFSWSVIGVPDADTLLGAAEPPILLDPTSSSPQLLAERPGQYVVQLIVNDGTVESKPDSCVVNLITPNCPKEHGYWATHLDAWPVESLMLGNVVYQKPALVKLLKSPIRGDASLLLARQLACAKLNLANMCEPLIDENIATSDSLLAQFSGPLPYEVKPSSQAGRLMNQQAEILGGYNAGELAANCAD